MRACVADNLREAVLEIDHALLDGVFEKALLEHLTGTGTALPSLHERALNLLPSLISG